MPTSAKYPISEEPIVLSKALLDTFLKQDKPSELISLYTFYYYTAKWQQTNQPKATTGYVAEGLKWGRDKVIKYKKQLIELGLIEDIQNRDESGKLIGHYIHVNFLWSQNKVKRIRKATPLKTPRVAKTDINALSSNKRNALSSNIKKINKKEPASFLENFPNRFKQNKEFSKLWLEWEQHRKEIKKPLKPTSAQRQISSISKITIELAIEALKLSIEAGYQKLVIPKNNYKQKSNSDKFNKNGGVKSSPGKYDDIEIEEFDLSES